MLLKDNLDRQGKWLFRYRGILPVVVLAIGLCEYLRMELNPGAFPPENTVWEYVYQMVCLAISLMGLAIRVYTVGHSPENTSGRNSRRQVADCLNTTGAYSVVRNPLYVGNFFMWLGIALLTANVWFIAAFILYYILYYERIIYTEEKFLLEKFGEEYRQWAEVTPCVLPRFRDFRKPSVRFSWKKVLRKEKNGLVALFLIFCLFDVSGELIEGNAPKYIWLAVTTGVLLVAYGVLKYLKHHTSVLNS